MSYIKPGPSYKMSSTTKRMLANIIDPHERGVQKRLMIQAELAAQVKVKEKKSRNAPDIVDES